jgi:hypothetical protein
MRADDKGYSICREENRLTFRTPTFRVGPDSVLHSGIYNREFSSMLASATVAGVIYVIIALNSRSALLSSMAFLLVFAAGILFFRKFIFKRIVMEVVFDIGRGEVKIFRNWIKKSLRETISLGSIQKISIERTKEEAENPDAVEFVKKISAQHGTVIPGFGGETVKFLLKLGIADGTERVIYSDDSMEDVMSAHSVIREFLKI